MTIAGAGQGLNWLSASDAAAQIASGQITARDLMEAIIDRISARDATVRAWSWFDAARALKMAEEADKIPTNQRGPLHGVPVGVKDILYTKDMPTQFNSPHFQGHFPNIDASCVALLRGAGALIIGKNDTVEFAVNGRRAATTNPHDPARTPGGSSSGSGAAVADGQVPLSIGTQTGGSVIRPASYCGVWAIKPTWNAVSHEGFKTCAASFDTLGWYGRSAADLDLLAEVFGIFDDEISDIPALKGLRIAVCRTPAWSQIEDAGRAALQAATAALEAAGVTVETLDLPPVFDGLPDAHKVIMQSEMRSAFLAEHRKFGAELYPEMHAILRNEAGQSRKDLIAAQDLAARCRTEFETLAAPYAAVLTPSTAGVAPLGPDNTGAATFNRIWTLLHMPCVNIPGLTGDAGLPIGVTLTGPRFSDRKLIALAARIGSLLDGAPIA
ncbi:amidase [Pararhodobacter oceanensis]|uniref:amidase n=1 Tax=Pararhodobacter oceanensis TaxID=2172121 RepID=UPI003A912C29